MAGTEFVDAEAPVRGSATGYVFAMLGGLMVACSIIDTPLSTLLLLLGSGMLVVALLAFPVRSLPAVAFVAFAAVPVAYVEGLPVWFGRFFSPAVVVLLLWAIRVLADKRLRPVPARTGSACLGVILIFCMVLLSLVAADSAQGILWTLVFGVCVVLPLLLGGPRSIDQRALLAAILVGGMLLGVVAVAEAVVGASPLGPYLTFSQHWSVYRVTTLLGHPLMNSTFFAVVSAIALSAAIYGTTRRFFAWAAFLAATVGVVLAGSRSGLVGWAVGVGAVLLFSLLSRRIGAIWKVVGVALISVAVAVVPNASVFVDRAGSEEAVESGAYRADVLEFGLALIDRNPWGYGPGSSADVARNEGLILPLENAVLGSIVSLGVPIFVLAILLLLQGVVTSVRISGWKYIPALAAYVLTGLAYPLWETNAGALAFCGFIFLLALGGDGARLDTSAVAQTSVHRAHSSAWDQSLRGAGGRR